MKADETLTQQMREQISALMDGHLGPLDSHTVVGQVAADAEARTTWHLYHLVGEVLRAPDAASSRDPHAFVARLALRLQAEPVRPQIDDVAFDSDQNNPDIGANNDHLTLAFGENDSKNSIPANDGYFRWQWVAGVAALSVAASLGWNLLSSQRDEAGGQMAVRAGDVDTPPATFVARRESTGLVAATDNPVMIRDPRLDALMAAHRQDGSISALHNQAGFLRNATYQEAGR